MNTAHEARDALLVVLRQRHPLDSAAGLNDRLRMKISVRNALRVRQLENHHVLCPQSQYEDGLVPVRKNALCQVFQPCLVLPCLAICIGLELRDLLRRRAALRHSLAKLGCAADVGNLQRFIRQRVYTALPGPIDRPDLRRLDRTVAPAYGTEEEVFAIIVRHGIGPARNMPEMAGLALEIRLALIEE